MVHSGAPCKLYSPYLALKVVLYRKVTECFIFCLVEMKKATSVVKFLFLQCSFFYD